MLEKLGLKNVKLDFGNIYNIPAENKSLKYVVISESGIIRHKSDFGINMELNRVLSMDGTISLQNSEYIRQRILTSLNISCFDENPKFINLTIV